MGVTVQYSMPLRGDTPLVNSGQRRTRKRAAVWSVESNGAHTSIALVGVGDLRRGIRGRKVGAPEQAAPTPRLRERCPPLVGRGLGEACRAVYDKRRPTDRLNGGCAAIWVTARVGSYRARVAGMRSRAVGARLVRIGGGLQNNALLGARVPQLTLSAYAYCAAAELEEGPHTRSRKTRSPCNNHHSLGGPGNRKIPAQGGRTRSVSVVFSRHASMGVADPLNNHAASPRLCVYQHPAPVALLCHGRLGDGPPMLSPRARARHLTSTARAGEPRAMSEEEARDSRREGLPGGRQKYFRIFILWCGPHAAAPFFDWLTRVACAVCSPLSRRAQRCSAAGAAKSEAGTHQQLLSRPSARYLGPT